MIERFLNNTRLLLLGAFMSYRALFAWLNPMGYLMTKVLAPIFQIVIFAYLGMSATGKETATYYVVGNAIQITALSGIFGVMMSVSNERPSGTLGLLFGTPANRLMLFGGRALMHVLDGMLGVFLCLSFGIIFLRLDIGNADIPLLILCIFVTTFATSALGLLLGSISLLTRDIFLLGNTVYWGMTVLCGVNFPVRKLPMWLQAASSGLPLTRGIAASRAIIAGANPSRVLPLLVGEVGVGLVYFVLGYVVFHRLEIVAKRRGTLELF